MATHRVADRVCLVSYGAAGTNRLRSHFGQLPLTMMPRTHHSKAQYHKKFFRSEDEHGFRPSLSLCNTRASVRRHSESGVVIAEHSPLGLTGRPDGGEVTRAEECETILGRDYKITAGGHSFPGGAAVGCVEASAQSGY